MLTAQVHLQDIKMTIILRKREDIIASIKRASEKSVGNAAEKARA